MALNQHLGFRREVTWGTWNAPNLWIPVTEAAFEQGQESIDPPVTGSGRAQRQSIRGAKSPTGSLSLPFYYERMGWFLIAAGLFPTTTTPVGATTARLHGFLPDDNATPASLSMQAQYSTAYARNVKGGVINKATMTVVNKGTIDFAADLLLEDEARSGGTWSDGSAAPAVIGSPTYFAGSILPFTAFDVSIQIGGTAALDAPSGVVSLTGATANTRLETLEVAIENNMSMQHLLNAKRNPGSVWAGSRKTTLTFDADWVTPNYEFSDYLASGSVFPVAINVTGAIIEAALAYELRIILPACRVNSAPDPALSGSMDRPMQSVELVAMEHPTISQDVNIVIQDTTASYAAA